MKFTALQRHHTRVKERMWAGGWGAASSKDVGGVGGGRHLFDDDLAVLVHGAVVDHADDGHAQVTPDAEGDAEAEAAQHGDDVAARQAEAGAVAQRSLALLLGGGSAVLRQLDHLTCLLLLLHPPAQHSTARRQALVIHAEVKHFRGVMSWLVCVP